MIKNEKGTWKISEICLNYVNKDVSYVNFCCFANDEDAESFSNCIDQYNEKIDPAKFDEYFSDTVLDNKGATASSKAYEYFQGEWQYFSK